MPSDYEDKSEKILEDLKSWDDAALKTYRSELEWGETVAMCPVPVAQCATGTFVNHLR
jgi:hypothetical protein